MSGLAFRPSSGSRRSCSPNTHFSVPMRLDKRLAAVTALGMDGTKLIDLDRSGIQWRLDPRLRADQQTGEMVYAGNDIDRGHLVRRASAVWGDTLEEAARANADTFHYTNAAPQAAKFNQGMDLWLGLESCLQDNAADNSRRLVVFTGPIFGDTDPVYRGVQIPLKFFKAAAFMHHGSLAATGYVVDQTPQLADLPDVPRPGALDEAPPLGPFRTFQVPIRDIAVLTGLDLEPAPRRSNSTASLTLRRPASIAGEAADDVECCLWSTGFYSPTSAPLSARRCSPSRRSSPLGQPTGRRGWPSAHC
ncbi:DNA/RNA non-specific endonuclease [Arthrobacter sp. NPDC056886]|uniref:DNA/RNA non-specific endonuclease n=1 Tax=Arthrobacter sp. NPDC056886 TaxID=3345960 RepID=UPI00366BF6AB